MSLPMGNVHREIFQAAARLQPKNPQKTTSKKAQQWNKGWLICWGPICTARLPSYPSSRSSPPLKQSLPLPCQLLRDQHGSAIGATTCAAERLMTEGLTLYSRTWLVLRWYLDSTKAPRQRSLHSPSPPRLPCPSCLSLPSRPAYQRIRSTYYWGKIYGSKHV